MSNDYETLTTALQQLQRQGETSVKVYGQRVNIDDVLAGIKHGVTRSYDELSDPDEESGNEGSLFRDYRQEDELEAAEMRVYVERYLSKLDSDQEAILRLHYGIGGIPALTVKEIAAELAVGKQYVRRTLRTALDELRIAIQFDDLIDRVD